MDTSDQNNTPSPAPTPAATPPAPKKDSWFVRALKVVLGTETRFGRWFRGFLRVAALVTGMFALGLLSGYLLLYRPTLRELATVKQSAADAQTDLQTAQDTLKTTQNTIAQLKTDGQAVTDQLSQEENHTLLLQVTGDVAAARMNLALKDNTAAKQALAATPDRLKKLVPVLAGVDAKAADAVQNRLELAISEIPGDTKTAASDLAILYEQLSDLEARLFPATKP